MEAAERAPFGPRLARLLGVGNDDGEGGAAPIRPEIAIGAAAPDDLAPVRLEVASDSVQEVAVKTKPSQSEKSLSPDVLQDVNPAPDAPLGQGSTPDDAAIAPDVPPAAASAPPPSPAPPPEPADMIVSAPPAPSKVAAPPSRQPRSDDPEAAPARVDNPPPVVVRPVSPAVNPAPVSAPAPQAPEVGATIETGTAKPAILPPAQKAPVSEKFAHPVPTDPETETEPVVRGAEAPAHLDLSHEGQPEAVAPNAPGLVPAAPEPEGGGAAPSQGSPPMAIRPAAPMLEPARPSRPPPPKPAGPVRIEIGAVHISLKPAPPAAERSKPKLSVVRRASRAHAIPLPGFGEG